MRPRLLAYHLASVGCVVLISVSGIDSRFFLRSQEHDNPTSKWMDRFQSTLTTIRSFDTDTPLELLMAANAELLKLSQDFLHCAKTYGRIVRHTGASLITERERENSLLIMTDHLGAFPAGRTQDYQARQAWWPRRWRKVYWYVSKRNRVCVVWCSIDRLVLIDATVSRLCACVQRRRWQQCITCCSSSRSTRKASLAVIMPQLRWLVTSSKD